MKSYQSILECQVYIADMRTRLDEHRLPEDCHCPFCDAARDEINLAQQRIEDLEAGILIGA